eukprot:TRINITY_DN57208_c0_g1_i1.p1 TRINITY_DN57208_c0_g1~~TRINITY_DN57208_c0_g1_i1.p1  ORF type:complete len:391 (+),score=84.41 TRINITY_DN57208_c0_g1_i1:196-1368(+)
MRTPAATLSIVINDEQGEVSSSDSDGDLYNIFGKADTPQHHEARQAEWLLARQRQALRYQRLRDGQAAGGGKQAAGVISAASAAVTSTPVPKLRLDHAPSGGYRNASSADRQGIPDSSRSSCAAAARGSCCSSTQPGTSLASDLSPRSEASSTATSSRQRRGLQRVANLRRKMCGYNAVLAVPGEEKPRNTSDVSAASAKQVVSAPTAQQPVEDAGKAALTGPAARPCSPPRSKARSDRRCYSGGLDARCYEAKPRRDPRRRMLAMLAMLVTLEVRPRHLAGQTRLLALTPKVRAHPKMWLLRRLFWQLKPEAMPLKSSTRLVQHRRKRQTQQRVLLTWFSVPGSSGRRMQKHTTSGAKAMMRSACPRGKKTFKGHGSDISCDKGGCAYS